MHIILRGESVSSACNMYSNYMCAQKLYFEKNVCTMAKLHRSDRYVFNFIQIFFNFISNKTYYSCCHTIEVGIWLG